MSLRCIFTRLALLLAVFLASVGASPVAAQSPMERLVSPGKLSEAHAHLEPECGSCHKSFRKSAERQLCLDCHEEIARDFATSSGFHGKGIDPPATECRTCHTEHEGRMTDIVGLDQETFDHRLTDFMLEGGHVGVDCASCHEAGETWASAPTDCFSCHAKDEPHEGALGEDCASCHNPKEWEAVSFDHDETDFPLLGKHTEAECMTCHEGEQWAGVETDCVSCHQEDDVHKGAFGTDCADCHEETGWQEVRFNHDVTGFRLRGGHAAIECEACHAPGQPKTGLPTDCIGCHIDDDAHDGRNGSDCASCHAVTNWQEIRFDHNETDFPLIGAHASTTCESCHVESVLDALPPTDCFGCHAEDDAHDGLWGTDCATCHVSTGWTEISFNHDTDTFFALNGEHETATCESCHVQPLHVELPGVGCVDCHLEDDSHEGQLGTDCASCHVETGWTETVSFDHDFTSFPLLGLHADVDCASCHETNAFADAETDCIACHVSDDAHDGRFGATCSSCHNPAGWEYWSFDHDTQTDFPLTGSHSGQNCYDCHTETDKAPETTSTTCISCHQKDDIHRGSFGRNCERCHTTDTFSEVEVR